MRVRIVSDGSPGGTRVEVSDEADVWRPLPHVVAVDWHLDAGPAEKAAAKITLRGVPVEVEADAEIQTTPLPRRLFERTERSRIGQPPADGLLDRD